MNNVSGQKQGSPQYMNQPCPGYSTGMPGQSGLPMTTMPPAMQPGQNLLSQMPTGMPGGPLYRAFPDSQQRMPNQAQVPSTPMAPGMGQFMSSQPTAPIVPWDRPMPVTTESLQYMNGFMRTQIGRRVTIEFLIGTNTLTDRTGTLLAVGADYILINEIETDDILLCDFYSMKFIKFYY
jgi:hypothetical protein